MQTRVRGHLGPHGWVFELYGESLALDFANTVTHRWEAEPIERLATPGDVVRFGVQAGLFSSRDAARLAAETEAHPRAASSALARTRAVREAIYFLFQARARGEPAPASAMEVLQRELPRAFSSLHLHASARQVEVRWSREPPDLDGLADAALRDAVTLLQSPERLERLRACDSQTCRWLFLDTTRNHSRRWCDMAVCGNRAKARRHYERRREE